MLDFFLKNNLLPITLLKWGIQSQLKQRLRTEKEIYNNSNSENKLRVIDSLKKSSVALSTQTANQQHYEVPTAFFEYVLGPKMKYSGCDWSNATTLEEAELATLSQYCERAELEDGQTILDLGCGWGSLSLYLAARYPNSTIVSVSNSTTQKIHIEKCCLERKLTNIQVITQDVNELSLSQSFCRIISIEMFEHVRNYKSLLQKLSGYLRQDGKLFIHHFCHHYLIYPFDSQTSWMAKHFFKDGLMPSEDTLLFFLDDFKLNTRWRVNGEQYAATCYAWLKNLFDNQTAIIEIFEPHYQEDAYLQFQYWHLFFRACAQLFEYNNGNEWFVSHYLLDKVTSNCMTE